MSKKTPIYSFWINGQLNAVNHLTVRSFQDKGHEFILYSYTDHANIGCEVRDAREILPESDIFYYKNFPEGYKFGGFAERLKSEMLYKLGGWHVDMDTLCIFPFTTFDKEPYVFRAHPAGIVANIIKAPAGSALAKRYAEHTKTLTSDNREWQKGFAPLRKFVDELVEDAFVTDTFFGQDSLPFLKPLFNERKITPPLDCYAIHWCWAWMLSEGIYENRNPHCFYNLMLKKYNL